MKFFAILIVLTGLGAGGYYIYTKAPTTEQAKPLSAPGHVAGAPDLDKKQFRALVAFVKTPRSERASCRVAR